MFCTGISGKHYSSGKKTRVIVKAGVERERSLSSKGLDVAAFHRQSWLLVMTDIFLSETLKQQTEHSKKKCAYTKALLYLQKNTIIFSIYYVH